MQNLLRKFEEMQNEKMLIEEAKLRRKNRKRLPKKDPITKEIFEVLMNEFETTNYQNRYVRSRVKVALTLLLVTDARISELLPLKMYQIETLFTNSWIAIDRSKRGPSNHKAFLTKQGIRILNSIRKDFEILLYYKSNESFIFTPQYSNKPLEREVFNHGINNFIKSASKKLDNEPLLTSQSFRIGYISKLWKDTEDIEFVRQVIGHVTVQSTSSYVKHFSDKEIEERMAQVKSVDDLIN